MNNHQTKESSAEYIYYEGQQQLITIVEELAIQTIQKSNIQTMEAEE